VKRQGKLMLLMMVDGDMDLLLLVRVKKKKGKKSRALPTERKKRMERESNHPDDVPAWEKSNIIIITIVRIDDGILYYYHLISPLPVCEFFYHQISTVRKTKNYLVKPTYF
jgi:hypothetical protein